MNEAENKPVAPAAKQVPAKKKPAIKKPAVPAATKETKIVSAPLNDGDPTEMTRKILAEEKKVTVVINSTEIDKDDVFVAVNGYAMIIQRDKEVPIPLSIYEALQNAKMTVYRQVKREDGEGMQLIETEVQRHSMSARF
jgi:CRISPR/Cas system-associated exonuclease Cas4 (RecB family)